MKRALVITLPERGHYHPLLGPAAELQRRGVEVAFAASFDIEQELRRAGVDLVLLPPGAKHPSEALRGERLSRLLTDPAALRQWIRAMLVDAPGALVDGMRAIVRDFRPDVVAIDAMAYEGAIAAELEGVPWVGWSTSLNPIVPDTLRSELIDTLDALSSERQALFAAHGLSARFRVSDVLSPRGTAVFSTEALVGPAEPGVALVGPSLGGCREGAVLDPRHGTEPDRPLVYVSFGSQAWYQPRRFDLLIDVALELEVALLVAMGDLAQTYQARGLPPHVRCVAFADQLAALSRASLFVTHGGANSVMEGLSRGVPLLVAPICNDQPHNRWFVERVLAGRGVDLELCTRRELVETMRQMLAFDSVERLGARRVAQSYGERRGEQGAAELASRACR